MKSSCLLKLRLLQDSKVKTVAVHMGFLMPRTITENQNTSGSHFKLPDVFVMMSGV